MEDLHAHLAEIHEHIAEYGLTEEDVEAYLDENAEEFQGYLAAYGISMDDIDVQQIHAFVQEHLAGGGHPGIISL